MNVIELLKLKPPYRLGQVTPDMVTMELIEYGTNKTGNIGFGSFVTNDGLTSFIACKIDKNLDINKYILCRPTLKYDVMYDSPIPKAKIDIGMCKSIHCHAESKVYWPKPGDSEDVRLELSIGPTVIFKIVNRSTLLKYFNRYKATSKPATDSVIKNITDYIAKEDQLPAEAKLILTTEYKTKNKKQNNFDAIQGPFIKQANTWQAKLVAYKSKLVLLISPDAGLYRFKPVCAVPQVIDKNKTPEEDLVTLIDNILLPSPITPAYYKSRNYHEPLLIDDSYKISTYLIVNVIWPALVPSRKVLAVVHLFPKSLSLCNSITFTGGDIERLIVSKYKNSNKLVVSRIVPRTNCKLNGWSSGNASYKRIEDAFLNNACKKVVWLADGVNYDELVNEIKLAYTLNAI